MISVLIPARNEKYLPRTVEDLYKNAVGEVEVLFKEDYGIGQRALTNELAKQARYDLVMKTDAHCSFGYAWDRELLKDYQENSIIAPYLMVLDAETWTVRPEKKSSQFVFDSDFIMLYGKEKDPMVNESMCLQGSCWLVSKQNYFDWNLGDERLNWGGQGVELGIKAFLNGGKCLTTKNTYYAHMFRTSDGEFPYDRGKEPGKEATGFIKREYGDKLEALFARYALDIREALSILNSTGSMND